MVKSLPGITHRVEYGRNHERRVKKMKEISLNTKFKVIKLFFAGLSYDEIAVQVGIAKGSVVNIIDQFREGKLPVPPGMTGYIDELRKLTVDMKKHSTTVSHLKGYIKLYAKITEMGVETDHVGQWLDICQEMFGVRESGTVRRHNLIDA